jgi:nuclear pore complex protein Nup210
LFVIPFDSENVFSTLVGLQFMWQLIPASLENSNHHLAHIPLKDTHLSDCTGFCVDMDARFELEDRVCDNIYSVHIILFLD